MEIIEETIVIRIEEQPVIIRIGEPASGGILWGEIFGDLNNQTDLSAALSAKSDTGHTHDDRYYTEAETDTLLSAKSDTGHTHDDRYYTEAETDTLLSAKSDTGHTHDDRYYTKTETGSLLMEKAAVIIDTASGDPASFPDGADSLPVKDLTVSIDPVQAGSGDPSPSNVRPITGWTGCNVTRVRKNLYDITKNIAANNAVVTISDNALHIVGDGSKAYQNSSVPPRNMKYKAGHTYYVKFKIEQNAAFTTYTRFVFRTLQNVVSLSRSILLNSGIYEYSGVFTLDQDCYATFIMENNANVATDVIFYDIMISEVDAPFEPFVGTAYPIAFPAEAGTVYGGTLDVTAGSLTVTHECREYDGSEDEEWSKNPTNPYFYLVLEAKDYIAAGSALSNIYPKVSMSQVQLNIGFNLANAGDTTRLYIRPEGYADMTVAQFRAMLDNQTFQVLYQLAAPVTYQLTPIEVTTLLGLNNIFADTGAVSVTYRADTKLYIDKKITALEALVLEQE